VHQKMVMACLVGPDQRSRQTDGSMGMQEFDTLTRYLWALSDGLI
jgi:hypothetical protein